MPPVKKEYRCNSGFFAFESYTSRDDVENDGTRHLVDRWLGQWACQLVVITLMLGLNVSTVQAVSPEGQHYDLNIAASSVVEALNLLAGQTGHMLLFDYDLAKDRRVRPVEGRYTIEDALATMLAGSGLSGAVTRRKVITVSAAHTGATTHQTELYMKHTTEPGRSLLGLIGTALVAVILSSPGQAEDISAASEVDKTRMIEEIVVTAQKREASLQATPIAITALSRERIQLNRIENFTDIAFYTPSMSYTQNQGMSQASIRGVGTDLTDLASEAAVAMYEDGVYRGASFAQAVPQFDLERIEILRGPQGTLYGRNATGGAINITTRLPSKIPEFNGSLTVGNYDRIRGELGASGPLTDAISGRVSFVTDSRNGYIDNKTLGRSEGDQNLKAGHAKLLFNFSEATVLVLRGNYTRDYGSTSVTLNRQSAPGGLGISPANIGGFFTFANPALGGLSLGDVFGLTFPEASEPIFLSPDKQETYNDAPSETDIKQYGYSATLTTKLWGLDTKLILARQQSKWFRDSDIDGTDLPVVSMDAQQSNRQNTAELNISSDYWGGRATWIMGGFYFQEDGEVQYYFDLDALQTTFEALFGVFGPGAAPLPPGSLAAFGTRFKTSLPSPAPFLDFRGTQDSRSWAAFSQTTVDVRHNLHVTLGLRYTDDSKEMHRELTNNLGGAPCDQRIKQDWNETTGTGIVSYDVSTEAMIYVSATKGFKAGGFNVGECGGAFDPESIWAYELGFKSRLLENRLQINGATFLYDYDDIQVNRSIENASSIENAAEAEIFGAEIEFVALIGDGFRLDGGVTHLSTEYAGGANFGDPIAGGPPINVDGNDLLRSPPLKLHVGAQYEAATQWGRFTLRTDVARSDRFYFDVFEASLPNQNEMQQDAYTIVNAHLNWDSTDGKYSVQLFGNNLSDQFYSLSRFSAATTGAVTSQDSMPRTYGLRVTMNPGGT